MASREDVAKMVVVMSAAFPNWKVNEYTVDVYYTDLKDIPAAELMAASQMCRTEAGRAFAPSTGEIRGAVMDIRRRSMNQPSSFEAWQEVQRQIVDVGSYGTPEFSNPLIRKTVDSLGWKALCMSENQTADRARFIQSFEQFSERAEKEMMLTPELKGYIEEHGGNLLEAGNEVKQLSERLSK